MEVTTNRLVAASLIGAGIGILAQVFITAIAPQPSHLNNENTPSLGAWN